MTRSRMRFFADYELLEELGHGGMGLVFKARQVSLDRTVALKIVRAGRLASEGDRERFQREARALARLRHPNIVAIHEVGEFEGQPYFAMDYVEGRNLAQVVREGPVSPEAAAGFVRRVAEAVHFAHQEGTLHRDLKPSNILLDGAGQPRITDFGIAKRIDGEAPLTASGEMLGTPGYMPPEQLKGSGRGSTPASDVYSMGAILYELVTGRRPFDIEHPLDAMMQVLHREPDSPRVHRPELDRDFETVCLKCLEIEPGRRYASARELADDLGRYLRGEPLAARPVSAPERAWRWCRRHPWPTLAGAALLLLSVVAVVSALTLRERLWRSLVDQARAERLAGRRQSSLERIAEAARLKRTEELRQEAVRTWIMPGVELLRTFPARRVKQLTIDADGHLLAVGVASSGETGDRLRIWDLHDGRETAASPSRGGRAGSFASLPRDTEAASYGPWIFGPGDEIAARSHPRHGVELRHLPEGRAETIPVAAEPIAFFSRGELLLLEDSGLVLRDLASSRSTPLTRPPLAISRDGRIAVLEEDFEAVVVRLPEYETLFALPLDAHPELRPGAPRPARLLLSDDGGRLAVQEGEAWTRDVAVVSIWDLSGAAWASSLLVSRLVLEPGSRIILPQAAFSPDGAFLAAVGGVAATHFVVIWNVETGEEVARLDGHSEPLWSADSGYLITKGPEGESGTADAFAWQVASPPPSYAFADEIEALSFSGDGRFLSVNSTLWEARPVGGRLLLARAEAEPGNGSAFFADDRSREPAGEAPSILARSRVAHQGEVRALAVSPDRRLAATGGDDRTIRLWDLAKGRELLHWQGHRGAVTALAFEPHGETLASGGADGRLRLWHIPSLRRGLAELGVE